MPNSLTSSGLILAAILTTLSPPAAVVLGAVAFAFELVLFVMSGFEGNGVG